MREQAATTETAATALPTGTVTILFTDIEGSTRLLQSLGTETYGRLLLNHHRLMRDAVTACQGVEIKTEGDAFFVVFPRAADAITATAQAQRALASAEWPDGSTVSVRMGLHTGDVRLSEGEYVGLDVHRAARISAAAHGGQVLLSEPTRAIVAGSLPAGVSLRDLGEHRLKDIDEPEHLYQLVIDGLREDFPPPRAMSARFDLLPAEMSTFIGRETELTRARELLANTRLLTLTGPGGTGKTRLALRLARMAEKDHADGAAFVALAPITEPRLVLPTIRQALGFAEQPGRTALETLTERLAGRELLLVLDNFEQVAEAAEYVAELLAAVPTMTVLVTSRVALHIQGEQEFSVPPLSLPDAAAASDLERLSRNESVALFVQRARAVRPDFALSATNAGAVAEICARLDGLPLAIELAASRVKLLPPAALRDRLERRLDLLQSTAADRTDRQRTLRGAIDWSYGLLHDPQRALFRRFAIFVGGARLEDAEPVVSAAAPLGVDVLDGLAALVDHSLVRQDETRDEPRFGMLETIREFGREQLQATGEFEGTDEAHSRHFAALVERAEASLTAGPESLDRLEEDHDNIRAAIAWLGRHDVQDALAKGGRLWRFWHLRGHLREGASILASLLAGAGAASRTPARAKALVGYAGLVYWQTNYAAARAAYEEALTIARELGDEGLEVEVLYSLAYVRGIEGDFAGAERDFTAARDLYEAQGNELMGTWALESIGMMATIAGDHERAVPLLEQSIAQFERLGDTFGLRNSISVLSRAVMQLGRLDHSRRLNRRVLELATAQRDLTSVSASMRDAASLLALRGDYENAARVTGAAQRIVDESGAEPPPQLVNRVEAMPTLEKELPPERLSELIAEGRALSTAEATELALVD